MATLRLIVVAALCLAAHALPPPQSLLRNTIFMDEKMEGGVFEHVDAFSDITLYNTASNPYRLPTTTKPTEYDIHWRINIEDKTFSGEVEITLQATQANVTEIVIHSNELEITSLELKQGSNIVPQTWSLQPEYHFLNIRPVAGPLQFNSTHPISYLLTIKFEAPLRKDMYGIYESWYRRENGSLSWMATTQFQATAARSAFPCYDEPSFKAVFNITITRPTTHTSWSCTKKVSQDIPDSVQGYATDKYSPTPLMSTYLLALIVAEYQSYPGLESALVVNYEVIARPQAIVNGQGDYAYNTGKKLLDQMSEDTKIDFYGVHDTIKMTQAAIPDFGAGAMENWGLLTYREAYLLSTEEDTNSYFRQLIAYILSHEIAHMWYGNLVTCDWWDVLWLNEGFARYFQYFLTNKVETDMGFEPRFIIEQVHTSLLSDSANSPHPLTNPGVGSPASVSAMFSTISYNKGAAIIRMTEHLLGTANHDAALHKYLMSRSEMTALPIHLFEVLQEHAVQSNAISMYESDFSIVDYYKTWTEQAGHPVLNVYVNHQTGNMTIYQRRFNINTGYSTASSNWIIPISFVTGSSPAGSFENTKPSHIIRDSVSVISRGSVGDEWVIFNKQQTGFYRVNYDDYTWNLNLIQLLQNRESIHEYNRAQIVNDVFQFARSGLMNHTRAFELLSFMKEETAYTPWVAFITGFNWLQARFAGTATEGLLNNKFIDWSIRVISEIGYDEPTPPAQESFMTSYLRYQLAPVLCRLGVDACITAAQTKFNSLFNETNSIPVPADSRNWVYCNALRYGTTQDFDRLWQKFNTDDVYTEKILLLQVLGCTPHQASLNTFLNAIVQDNFVIRPQDYTTAFNSALTGNEGNTQIVFTFIQSNLQAVEKAFGSITAPLASVASRLRTQDQIQEFRTWADNNQAALGTSYQAVMSLANDAEQQLMLAASIKDDVESGLQNEVNVATSTSAPTPAPTPPSTVTVPPLVSPSTPNLPDAATTPLLSTLLLTLAVVFNYVV